MRKLRIFAVLLLWVTSGFAVTNCTRYDSIAQQNKNGVNYVIPNASVQVCPSTATGIPCTPTATVYSDNACSVVIGTATADVNGNFHFYADSSKQYKYQVTGANVALFEVDDLSLPFNPAQPPAISASSINSAQTPQPVADIGIALSAANTALIAGTGGTIDGHALTGAQTCTTNFTLGAAGKPVKLIVPEGAQWSGACQATIASSESGIEWEGSVPSYGFDQPTTAPWKYTPTTGCGITVSPGVRGAFIRNLLFRGAGTAGTADLLCAQGDTSNSTAITGLDLSGSDFDSAPRDGIHFVGAVYGFTFTKCRASRNLRYGFAALSDGTSINFLNQAFLNGCTFDGNLVQQHIEAFGTASVELTEIAGTDADTIAGATSGNGIEIIGINDGSAHKGTATIHILDRHSESIGGSVDGGTPDITNANIYLNVQNGKVKLNDNVFIPNGPHPHDAITLGPQATCLTLEIGSGNTVGSFATEADLSTPTTGCGTARVLDTAAFSKFSVGTYPVSWLGGQSTTVANLPSATINSFVQLGVTDSTAIAAEGQTCVGGSSNKAIAISNGTVWKCF